MMMSLKEIGLKEKTDKALFHNFCDIYDEVLKDYRNLEINFLEIGIQNGYSLKMWSEYFTKAKIYGADIDEKRHIDDNRIKTFKVNQEDKNQLLSIPGEFDIIIDDGGHTMLQQQVTLSTMFKKLKRGGLFILEDLHTSNPEFYGYQSFGANNENNTIRLLKDLMNKKMTSYEYFISKDDFDDLISNIDSIELFEIDPVDVTKQGCKSITSLIRKVNDYI
jgi:hypothetical protein